MAELTSTSSREGLSAIGQPYCRRLRCKEMFIDTGVAFHPAESGSGIYWCNSTQNCLGPDGEIAHVDACKPGRACFEEF